MPQSDVTFRRGTPADSYKVFDVMERSLADLNQRIGSPESSSADDPQALEKMWDERHSLYDHLAHSADLFWLAERDNRTIGLSRSICRDGLRILTELFVLPTEQSAGTGKELLARSFPNHDAGRKIIISSPDKRAQALYSRAGMFPRFTINYYWRVPEAVKVDTDLAAVPMEDTPETIKTLGILDKTLFGYRRNADHSWLLTDRQGYLYYRHGRPVGYGYIGHRSGPFALLSAKDFPAVLAHAESKTAQGGSRHFGLEVPAVNQAAFGYITARGYQKDLLEATLMSNVPFGKFENYLVTSPPFIL